MTAAHTPGPWHIGMKPGPMIYGQNGEQIADMRRPAMVDDNEHAANARLIASAPDTAAERDALKIQNAALLVALEELSEAVKATREGKRDGYAFGALSNADDKARAAIAQAKEEKLGPVDASVCPACGIDGFSCKHFD